MDNIIVQTKKYKNIGYETNLLLSQNVKLTFNTWKTHLGCMNVLVIGATGEGKSRNFVRPVTYSLLRDPKDHKLMSYVFTDPKGELYRDTAGFLEANGYEIKVLNLVDMLHSDCYNCFKYFNFGNNPDITIMNYINGLVEASSGEGNKEPYWKNMAKNLINSLAFYCYYELPAEMQNMTTVSEMINLFYREDKEPEAPIDYLYKKTCKNIPLNKHPAMLWRSKLKKASGKELGSIMGSANDALRLWADSNVRRITEVDTLNLDKVGDKPTAIYVITPPDNSTFDFIVGTFYDQLISTIIYKSNFVYGGNGVPHHVILMQDEAANTGKINDYHKKIAVWRSANLSSVQIVQSSSQFKAMYGDKAQDVIDNAHITIFLGNGGNSIDGNGTAASDFISRALGKTTVKTESYSLNYQKNELDPSINSSINLSQRELMTPDEVKRLRYDECIVMIKGFKPFIDKKINLDTCLNYASDLFSTSKETTDSKGKKNISWKLKKEFIYEIDDKIKTLNTYKKGFTDFSYIDSLQCKTVKERLIIDSEFASIKKSDNLTFIDNSNFLSFDDKRKFIRNNFKYLNNEYLLEEYKKGNKIIDCFIRNSIITKPDNDNDTKKNDDEVEMSLEDKKEYLKVTAQINKIIKEATKGKIDNVKNFISSIL